MVSNHRPEVPIKIGFHASHEQFPPEELLELARLAQQAGFESAMCSDHFHPWSPSQGQSGFTWSWLGAAMQATDLPFGTMAIPGGWRYHPAIVAQAGATLSRMFPGRFLWLALGSGEALNERIVGQGWPDKAERNHRLKEAAEIIRALWAGETVNRDGAIPVEEARLYTGPHDPPPLLYGAALSPETAEWLGGWADGLLTVGAKKEQLRPIVDAFRRGGGEGKKLALQVHVSWAQSDVESREQARRHWRFNVVPPGVAELLRTPEQFEAATSTVRPEDMEDYVLMSSDPAFYVEALREFGSLGFEELYVHNVGGNQRAFLESFGREVLPHLGDGSPGG